MLLQRVRQAVVLAGGYGRRMLPLTQNHPKPMIPINGRPFLERLIEWLRASGTQRITILAGWKAEQITSYFGDGRSFGVTIDYAIASPDVETTERILLAKHLLDPEFLLAYGDVFCPINLRAAESQWLASGLPAQTTLYDNADSYSTANARWKDALLTYYDPQRRTAGLRGVEIGFTFLKREALNSISGKNRSIAAELLPSLIDRDSVGAFVTRHRYYGPSSPARLSETVRFFNAPPTIVLDRDGVLNEKRPPAQYVTGWPEWKWIPGALQGVRTFHQAGWRVFVATNQPGVARGHLTSAKLDEIHARMRADISTSGGRVHDLFACTHGWNSGCDCRKPRPGLLHQAQREWALNLPRTYFAGDDSRDREAALAAGCKFIQVTPATHLGSLAEKLTRQHSQSRLEGDKWLNAS